MPQLVFLVWMMPAEQMSMSQGPAAFVQREEEATSDPSLNAVRVSYS